VRMAAFEFIEMYYNRKRIQRAIGYLSPAEFESGVDKVTHEACIIVLSTKSVGVHPLARHTSEDSFAFESCTAEVGTLIEIRLTEVRVSRKRRLDEGRALGEGRAREEGEVADCRSVEVGMAFKSRVTEISAAFESQPGEIDRTLERRPAEVGVLHECPRQVYREGRRHGALPEALP
jgi:hypothetical protein